MRPRGAVLRVRLHPPRLDPIGFLRTILSQAERISLMENSSSHSSEGGRDGFRSSMDTSRPPCNRISNHLAAPAVVTFGVAVAVERTVARSSGGCRLTVNGPNLPDEALSETVRTTDGSTDAHAALVELALQPSGPIRVSATRCDDSSPSQTFHGEKHASKDASERTTTQAQAEHPSSPSHPLVSISRANILVGDSHASAAGVVAPEAIKVRVHSNTNNSNTNAGIRVGTFVRDAPVVARHPSVCVRMPVRSMMITMTMMTAMSSRYYPIRERFFVVRRRDGSTESVGEGWGVWGMEPSLLPPGSRASGSHGSLLTRRVQVARARGPVWKDGEGAAP